LERIQAICEEITVPVIVKETGFGMSYESVKKLSSLSLGAVDIGGFGGTNFAAIENERRKKALSYFNNWGIPTAASIIEAAHAANQLDIIASGGIQDSLDIVKSFALGAKAAGLAGYLLKILLDEGLHAVIEEVQTIHGDIKMIMCALGAEKIADLDKVAVVFTGELYQWLQARGLEPDHFSRRSC
ncbi:MAG TPA: alpha-hydroxy-acid oxidizing protein, partial [Chondromyces sp.]|nr:alpha-hydroxy-acid oxidizing protein [Chondromyces sp.]